MITFTGDPIFLGDTKQLFDSDTDLYFDVLYRAEDTVIAILYAKNGDEVIGTYETEYSSANVNGETVSGTTYTEKINEAVHLLEKDRLETKNPTNTFTITL
jgi:hypothetical protein